MRSGSLYVPLFDVAGHRHLLALLSRSVSRGTLPPSLIFAGPEGVGKTLTAVATAQLLNCLSPVTTRRWPDGEALALDACGECLACTRIARRVHSDVLILEPGDTGSIRIEAVRDVIERTAYRPFEGRCRVVIIDGADALVPAAQNALLKTLEEPPPSSVFILVTAHPDSLLATVLSRCQRLRFGRPKNTGAAVEDDRETAQLALMTAAASRDQRGRLEGAKDLVGKTGSGGASDRAQLATHLRVMASLIRDAELLSCRADTSGLANPDLLPALERLAQTYRGERGVNAFAAIDRALDALDRNSGVKVVADWVMLQL